MPTELHPSSVVHLAEIAGSPGPLPERGRALLAEVSRCLPFDFAWLSLAEPEGGCYPTLAQVSLDRGVAEYLIGPGMARDIEVTGTDRDRSPLSPSDLP